MTTDANFAILQLAYNEYCYAKKLPLCFGELQDTTEGMGAVCSFLSN